MPPCPVLGLNDPDVGIEADFLGETFFDRWLGYRLQRGRSKQPLRGTALVIDGLWRGRVQHRIAIERRHLDEHRARLFRAAPAHRAEYAFGLAAAQVSRHPYR